ncbi:TrmH family RNA methyltransferase [Zavarzinia compransoris]|uniref:RNA methyltransferase n=1 Tax=Zavarzinia compransoris TaxID=1264899 RepID=A0A317EBN6_9PROT|nr:RNA methyltransferase [Zavarzinia compransoris]PWR24002.1 RNA methyltransferase [Zavarzinia compransoris]TDP48262.1 TrmH family RNA methyltransferase [Zavarzinia compransoris]
MTRVIAIDSEQNERFRTWERLLEGRGIRKHGAFLLAGRKTVPEALAAVPDRFTAVIAPDTPALDQLAPLLPAHLARHVLARPLFERLDVSGTRLPLLVGTVPAFAEADLAAPPRGLELACALGDPSNLGALLRSAAAFGVRRVILLPEAAHPFHPKCLRGAANAVFRLDFVRTRGWAALAAGAGPLLALDGGGADLTRFSWPGDLRLVLGEEGQGLPADLAAARLAIPTSGAVESLNATVAASIALQHWFSRRPA